MHNVGFGLSDSVGVACVPTVYSVCLVWCTPGPDIVLIRGRANPVETANDETSMLGLEINKAWNTLCSGLTSLCQLVHLRL